ncbi:class I SAM-dependent methyltransferase [Pacificimonas sp. ICDLI1SI03]
MFKEFITYFRLNGHAGQIKSNELIFDDVVIPLEDGIPRFIQGGSYSAGNFEKLRTAHATLQLDSRNGTTDRYDTILRRTGWSPDFFKGKTVLECGCGAGPDTEILLAMGAKVVAVDLAGLDVARANLGDRPDLCLVQASIADLPLLPHSFDIVFCHRVIMHTPDPKVTLDHILRFVKPDGAVFVHSYSRDIFQMARWKYVLRPLTKRMSPERLYRMIHRAAPVMFRLTQVLNRSRLGRRISWHFLPFLNYSAKPEFSGMSDVAMLEYAVHDTFDALSPPYDSPLSERDFKEAADMHLKGDWEVETGSAITLLRSRVAEP